MMFARSGSGGSGRGDDYYDDDYDYQDDEPNEAPQPAPRSRAIRGGSGGAGDSGGRQRTVQFQSDERYWTEYLRIALPVIGLLLMLGLFWYWAQQLISDDSSPSEPVATEPAGNVAIITPTALISTPTPTIQVLAPTVAPTQKPAGAATQAANTGNTGDNQAGNGSQTTSTPTPEPAADGLAIGDTVTINDDGVNLRPDASTTGNPVGTLNQGDQFTIVDGPTDDGTYTWWKIQSADKSVTGWVVDTYLDASGG